MVVQVPAQEAGLIDHKFVAVSASQVGVAGAP